MAHVTSGDGTRIAYSKVGSGPALVIVCGATQFRAFDANLAALANLLAPQLTIITYHGPKPDAMAPVIRDFLAV